MSRLLRVPAAGAWRPALAVLIAAVAAFSAAGMASTTPAAHAAACALNSENDNIGVASDDRVLELMSPFTNRTPVRMWSRTGALNQRWCWQWVGTSGRLNVYEIRNAQSGLCLDASADAGPRDGAPVYGYACHHGTNQRWALNLPPLATTFSLVNVWANRCLDIKGANRLLGARLVVWQCTSGWNQRWRSF